MLRLLTALLFFGHVILAQEIDSNSKASHAYHQGNYKEALQHLQVNFTASPSPEDYLLRAMINWKLNQISNADEDFIQAITADKDFYEAYFQYANFLLSTGEEQRAIAAYSFLLSHMDKGETKMIFFRMDGHGQDETQISSLANMEAEVLFKRAIALTHVMQYEEALIDLNHAIEISNRAELYVQRGLIWAILNEQGQAKSDFNSAIALSPTSALAWYNLLVLDPATTLPTTLEKDLSFAPLLSKKAIELMSEGALNEAIQLFETALELTPNDPVLLLNTGRCYSKNLSFDEAMNAFQKSWQLDPSKKEALYLIGNVHFGRENFREAIHYYKQYLLTNPTSADIWYNSGMAYLQLDEEENGCSCIERAKDLGMWRAEAVLTTHCTKE